MKIFISLIILTLLPICVYAQSIYKTWIGTKNHHYLNIIDSKKAISIDGDFTEFSSPTNCKIDDTTLILYGTYYKPKNNVYLYPFVYTIKNLTKDSLVLEYLAINEFDKNETLTFIDSQSLYDGKFSFDSIYFSSSICYGTCPETKLLIKYTGEIIFQGGQFANEFNGSFKGELTRRQLFKLKHILKKSAFTTFPSTTEKVYDAPFYEFHIYYANKLTSFAGYYFPHYNHDLLLFLTDYKKFRLKKCDTCLISNPHP